MGGATHKMNLIARAYKRYQEGNLDLWVRDPSGAVHSLKGGHGKYSQIKTDIWGYGCGTTVLVVA